MSSSFKVNTKGQGGSNARQRPTGSPVNAGYGKTNEDDLDGSRSRFMPEATSGGEISAVAFYVLMGIIFFFSLVAMILTAVVLSETHVTKHNVDILLQNFACPASCVERCDGLYSSPHEHREKNHCVDVCIGRNGKAQINVAQIGSNISGNPVSNDFGIFPWDILTQGDETRMFVTTQDGKVYYSPLLTGKEWSHANEDSFTWESVLYDVTAWVGPLSTAYSEKGLLGLTLHPKFFQNGLFYVSYANSSAVGPGGAPPCSFSQTSRPGNVTVRAYDPTKYLDTVIFEERVAYLNPSTYLPDSYRSRILLTLKHPFTNHYGIDHLKFEENGDLLAVVSDGGCKYDQFDAAQNKTMIWGKVLIFDVDAPNVTKVNCTTPVATFPELNAACPHARTITNIYAMGVRNAGHLSLFVNEYGINERYIAMIGQDDEEAVFRLNYNDNYGWFDIEGSVYTCLEEDPARNPRCDFTKSRDVARNERANRGYYERPLITLNQVADKASSIVGGDVYHGNQLPCNLRGAYIFGDWSQQRKGLGFPAQFKGDNFHLFFHNPLAEAHNPSGISGGVSHTAKVGFLQVETGLPEAPNYLSCMGYDKVNNLMYLMTLGQIAPYTGTKPASNGRIFRIDPPRL